MKKLLILFSVLFLCGCSSKESIVTIIEDYYNTVIAINYPITGISKLDKKTINYVNNIYDEFKAEHNMITSDKSELNIDFTYNVIGQYINITITTFIESSDVKLNEIKTLIFNKESNKFVTIKDIIDEKDLGIFVNYLSINLIKQYPNFIAIDSLNKKISKAIENLNLVTFNYDNLTIYFNPDEIENKDIIKIDVPFDRLDLLINIENKDMVVEEENYTAKESVIDVNKPVVALTFDDGPSKYTTEILDILNQYDAKATFFVLGNKVEIYKDTMKKMVKLGNEVGNHTYNHKWGTRLDIEDFKDQIDRTQNIIKETTGFIPKYFRPTYGAINKKIKDNIDLNVIFWTLDSNDWKMRNSKKIAERINKKVKNGDIILMHDTYEKTLKAIKILVPALVEQGYQFITISTLEELNKLKKN